MTVSTVSKWHFKISWYDNWHVKVRIWLEYVKIKTTSEFSAPTSRIRILGVYIYIKNFSVSWEVPRNLFEKKNGQVLLELRLSSVLVLPEQIQARSERFLYLVGNPHTHTHTLLPRLAFYQPEISQSARLSIKRTPAMLLFGPKDASLPFRSSTPGRIRSLLTW